MSPTRFDQSTAEDPPKAALRSKRSEKLYPRLKNGRPCGPKVLTMLCLFSFASWLLVFGL